MNLVDKLVNLNIHILGVKDMAGVSFGSLLLY